MSGFSPDVEADIRWSYLGIHLSVNEVYYSLLASFAWSTICIRDNYLCIPLMYGFSWEFDDPLDGGVGMLKSICCGIRRGGWWSGVLMSNSCSIRKRYLSKCCCSENVVSFHVIGKCVTRGCSEDVVSFHVIGECSCSENAVSFHVIGKCGCSE